MTECGKGLTAAERLRQLRKDQARVRRDRLQRKVAGPRWLRMLAITPVLFRRVGRLDVRTLCSDRESVIEALKDDAVFAADTALRIRKGHGFLSSGDIFAYITSVDTLTKMAAAGLIQPLAEVDTTLIRPWPGPRRLLVCIVDRLPPFELTDDGYRVVTQKRLEAEMIGLVGARADLFALVEESGP